MVLISVIVPTYNRADDLLRVLDSLLNQTMDITDYEVIVVNDGSTDNTSEVLDAYSQRKTNVRAIHQPNQGPAAARNAGLHAATAPLVAFTDDDCIVDEKWLDSIVNVFAARESVVVVQGQTKTDISRRHPLTHEIHNVAGHSAVPTCNAAYRREVALECGGFDEAFRYAHNEDADLAWRAQEFGDMHFEPSIKVFHPPRPVAFTKVARRMRLHESEFLLFYKNPKRYRSHRSSSPWKTIYWTIGVRQSLSRIKQHLRLYRRPRHMLTGLSLDAIWFLDLLRLFPTFYVANRRYRALVQGKGESVDSA